MIHEPSILENLPDKVLRTALKIIKPEYTGDYDDLTNDGFTLACDDIIRMTSLRDNDYAELEDYSFLHKMLELNPDFESLSDEPLIRPKFNNFTLDWSIIERMTREEVYQHSSGSYSSDGSDLPELFRLLFSEGSVHQFDGNKISEDILESDIYDDFFVHDSIKKI